MQHPFDKSNCRWLLLAFYRQNMGLEKVPSAIFDRPEDCFEKFPGTWHEVNPLPIYLRIVAEEENYSNVQYFQLMPVPYSPKKSC